MSKGKNSSEQQNVCLVKSKENIDKIEEQNIEVTSEINEEDEEFEEDQELKDLKLFFKKTFSEVIEQKIRESEARTHKEINELKQFFTDFKLPTPDEVDTFNEKYKNALHNAMTLGNTIQESIKNMYDEIYNQTKNIVEVLEVLSPLNIFNSSEDDETDKDAVEEEKKPLEKKETNSAFQKPLEKNKNLFFISLLTISTIINFILIIVALIKK